MSRFDYETIFTIEDPSGQELTLRVNGIGIYIKTVKDGPEVALPFEHFHQLTDHVKTLIPARQSGSSL